VLGSMSVTFSITFPPIYSSVITWLSVVELPVLELMPLSCYGIVNNYYTRLVMRTALPLAFILICVLIKLCAKLCSCVLNIHATADKLMSAAFFVIFLLYPTNSQKIFTTFLCRTFDDPAQTRVLIVDYTSNCKLPEHQLMELYAIVMFIYPFGTPLLYAYLTFYAHGRRLDDMKLNEILRLRLREEALADILHTRHLARAKMMEARKELRRTQAKELPPVPQVLVPGDEDLPDHVVKHIKELEKEEEELEAGLPEYVKKLIGGYKRRDAHFEIFECFRKLALVCMPVWFEPGSVAQLIFGLMVCFVTFGAYTAWAPFAEERANVLAQACQVQIFFALCSAIALSFDVGRTEESSRSIDVLLTVLTFVPLSMTVVLRTPVVRLLEQRERAKLEMELQRLCCSRHPQLPIGPMATDVAQVNDPPPPFDPATAKTVESVTFEEGDHRRPPEPSATGGENGVEEFDKLYDESQKVTGSLEA
jgi:hypothetical protein